MNKTHLSILLLVGLLVILFTLWSPPLEKTAKLPAPDQAAPAEVIELRFGHNIPTNSAMHQAALRFAKEVASKSEGRVNVTVYPEQQLGNDHEMVEMARAGELDILLTPTAKMSVPVPAMQYADMPFIFPSREDAYELLDGEVGQMLLDRMRPIGLIGVTFWENGFKHFTGNKPLLKPDDYKGLDIRVMKSRILMEQFKAFGANPVPIDFHATRKALADGVVDGQENPLIAIVSMGFHEVQSDLTLSGHGYLCYVLSFSEKVFNKLPGDIQQILTETARDLTEWEREETQRREEQLLQTIREAGVTIHTLDNESRRQFATKTAHIADQYEEVIGADIMSKTQELLYRKYGTTEKERPPIVIGLDADLSKGASVAGLALKRGAALAIEDINRGGGVLGRPLKLIARDHKGLPALGKDNIDTFAADPNVVAVMGGLHSAVVTDELESIHGHKIPFLAPWSAAAKVVENEHSPNFVFRVSANDSMAADFIIEHATHSHSRPAIIFENSVWGRDGHQQMQQRLQELNIELVYEEVVNRGMAIDFSMLIKRLLTKKADVVVLILNPVEGGGFIEAMAKQPAPLPVVAHWGIVGGDIWKKRKNAINRLELNVFQTFSFLDNDRTEAMAVSERYTEHYAVDSSREIILPTAVAQSYDLVQLLAMAIKQAGTIDRAAVRDTMEQLPAYDGVIKRYQPAFTPERHDALDASDYRMMRFAPDGALVALP
jgi:tripartite ATP-independent transporter DctP family solute receptor